MAEHSLNSDDAGTAAHGEGGSRMAKVMWRHLREVHHPLRVGLASPRIDLGDCRIPVPSPPCHEAKRVSLRTREEKALRSLADHLRMEQFGQDLREGHHALLVVFCVTELDDATDLGDGLVDVDESLVEVNRGNAKSRSLAETESGEG